MAKYNLAVYGVSYYGNRVSGASESAVTISPDGESIKTIFGNSEAPVAVITESVVESAHNGQSSSTVLITSEARGGKYCESSTSEATIAISTDGRGIISADGYSEATIITDAEGEYIANHAPYTVIELTAIHNIAIDISVIA